MKTCKKCGKEFPPAHRNSQYCSRACAQAVYLVCKSKYRARVKAGVIRARSETPKPKPEPTPEPYSRYSTLAATPEIAAESIRDEVLTGKAAARCVSYSRAQGVGE